MGECNVSLEALGLDQAEIDRRLAQGRFDEYQETLKEFSASDGESLAAVEEKARAANVDVAAMRARISSDRQSMKDTCGTVDLRPKLPPVRDQGSHGWCYAYAVADLLSLRLKKDVSASDIAINYILSENGESTNPINEKGKFVGIRISFQSGGQVGKALESVKAKGGACLESDLPSRPVDGATVSDLAQLYETVEAKGNLAAARARTSRGVCEDGFAPTRQAFPKVTLRQYMDAMTPISDKSIIFRLAEGSCQSRIPLDPGLRLNEFDGDAEGMNKVDEQLDKDQAVAMSYRASLIGAPSYANRHASTVVGRRWNEAELRCEYLVRNSWGDSCKNESGEAMYGRRECEGGNIWVPRGQFIAQRGLKFQTLEP